MTADTEARRTLEKSVRDNRQQTLLAQESRDLVTSVIRVEMRDEMRVAVAEGIAAAMTDDNAQRFVRAVLTEAQALATAKTGEVVGGAVMALVKRAMLFTVLGLIVYSVGGWTALAAMAKFFAASKE